MISRTALVGILISSLVICILIISIFCIRTEQINYIPSSDKPKEIAIIGNGPLTVKEMDEINKKDKVYRFNAAPKFRKGRDRIDGLFLREIGNTGKTHGDAFLAKNKDIAVEKIYIGEFNSKFRKESNFIGIYEREHNPNSPYKNKKLFPTCNYCKDTNNCYHKNSRVGPSSGSMGIEYLLDRYPQANLHIYGMNWHPTNVKHGHLPKQKNIITKCCPNCIIHKTSKNSLK